MAEPNYLLPKRLDVTLKPVDLPILTLQLFPHQSDRLDEFVDSIRLWLNEEKCRLGHFPRSRDVCALDCPPAPARERGECRHNYRTDESWCHSIWSLIVSRAITCNCRSLMSCHNRPETPTTIPGAMTY